MKYNVTYKNKQYSIACYNLRNLHSDVAVVIPELNQYQNYRYSLSVLAIGDDIKFIVNMVVRQETYDAMLFEKIRIASPATNYVRVSPIYNTLEAAIGSFNSLCEEFEKHTNVSLGAQDTTKKKPRRTSKKNTETF